MDNQITYELAMKQLEEIVAQLEAGDIGMDEMPDTLKRAGELLQYCQTKLRMTESAFKDFTEEQKG